MLKLLHPMAGGVALVTIATFWLSTAFSEVFGSEAIVVAVKTAIPWGFLLLIPAIALAGGKGYESADDWEETGISWENAPAHDPNDLVRNQPRMDKSRLLGRFEVAQGISRGTRSIRGEALRGSVFSMRSHLGLPPQTRLGRPSRGSDHWQSP